MFLPVTDDRDSGPFFAAAREGRLVYRACTACDRGIHPPVPFCPHCGSNGEWREASGKGRIHASTVVTHQIHPDYPVPYTLVVVELDDCADVRLLGRIEGDREPAHGSRAEVWFEAAGEDVVLPNWKVSGESF